MAKAMNTGAIEKASRQNWPAWVAYLEDRGGGQLSHPELAKVAQQRLDELGVDNAGWWAQGVAVAYEQEIGRRAPGQRADGMHEFSVSKTFGRDLDHALETWSAVAASASPFRDLATEGGTSTSATEKWRYWRASFADGTKVQVTIGMRDNGRPFAALTHSGFAEAADLDEWKSYWRDLLGEAAARAKAGAE